MVVVSLFLVLLIWWVKCVCLVIRFWMLWLIWLILECILVSVSGVNVGVGLEVVLVLFFVLVGMWFLVGLVFFGVFLLDLLFVIGIFCCGVCI